MATYSNDHASDSHHDCFVLQALHTDARDGIFVFARLDFVWQAIVFAWQDCFGKRAVCFASDCFCMVRLF